MSLSWMEKEMSRRLLKYPDLALREKAKRIEKINEETYQVADSMLEVMFNSEGIGLAACQIGVPVRLITINVNGDFHILVNPEIEEVSEENIKNLEGCLSIPGVNAQVERPMIAQVRGIDLLDGKEEKLEREGLAARVLLHEIDHLDGILFIDHLGQASRTQVLKKYKQAQR